MAKGLLRSVSTVSAMTFISRVLGFARDMILANIFGANASFDAFLVAFKIPNFMRRLFAEGAFSQAFIPILSEYKSQQSMDETKALTHRVFSALFLTLTVVSILGILFSGPIVQVFAPGFADDARFALTVTLLQVTFPYLLLISLTAFAAGILNTYRFFSLPAFTPVLLNIALIGAALWMTGLFAQPVVALAWGVIIGGIGQLALQLFALWRMGFFPRFTFNIKDAGVIRILKLMGPAVLGASVMQINLLVDAVFASFLPVGSVTWLYYSERLMEFPLGMFGVALSTVILPHLSEHFAAGRHQAFSASIDWALRWTVLIGVPAVIGLSLLRQPILITLFQYGAFSSTDSLMSSKSLLALCAGLIAFIGVKVLVSAFYAQQNTRLPVKIAIMALLTNVILNAVFIGPLQHAGLALASSISAWLNALTLLIALVCSKQFTFNNGWPAFMARLGLSSLMMAAVLIALIAPAEQWAALSAGRRVLELGGIIGLAGAVFAGTLLLTGLRPIHLSYQAPSP